MLSLRFPQRLSSVVAPNRELQPDIHNLSVFLACPRLVDEPRDLSALAFSGSPSPRPYPVRCHSTAAQSRASRGRRPTR